MDKLVIGTKLYSIEQIEDYGDVIEEYPVDGSVDGVTTSNVGDAVVYFLSPEYVEVVTFNQDTDKGKEGEKVATIIPAMSRFDREGDK